MKIKMLPSSAKDPQSRPIPIPDLPTDKESWDRIMIEDMGEEWFKANKAKLDRDWPHFKTLL